MKSRTVLGIIDLPKFIETEAKFSSFNLFDSFLLLKTKFELVPTKLREIYAWKEIDENCIYVKKKRGPGQMIVKKLEFTPEFFFNTSLYDAEGGKKSNTLVSNSDERIVRGCLDWFLKLQPSLDGIREIRLFVNADEAEKIFDFSKLSSLIGSGKITSKDPRNVNQPYSVLQAMGVIADKKRLQKMIWKYLGYAPQLRRLLRKLRIKWDPQHKKAVFEVYYTQTLNPLLPSLSDVLIFKLPHCIKRNEDIPWIEWKIDPPEFLNMGVIDLENEQNRLKLLSSYKKIESVDNKLRITRGKSMLINSKLKISPSFLFGLAHYVTEKLSTSTPWELNNYVDFISVFGDPEELISNVSIVFLAEEYAVLMKRFTTLFDKDGSIRNLEVRHHELEQEVINFLINVTGIEIPLSKVRINKIPYKEGIAVLMFHFPQLFQDLVKLARNKPKVMSKIKEVIKERGLGRHAGKASIHVELKGTLLPLIRCLSEYALNDFNNFFDKYANSHIKTTF